ncbi:unnamed protein product [Orchesella dallaii]|uniref:Uncharacterized protein n=1 Tax=Orchesella dallaii TaxID=48710 RepID=A0ABP1RQE2_9HEXA
MAAPAPNAHHRAQPQQNNGGGGGPRSYIFGIQIPNWNMGVGTKIVCSYIVILFQILVLVLIGVKLGLMMVTAYENNSIEGFMARELAKHGEQLVAQYGEPILAQYGIPDSMMSALKYPQVLYFGRYDKINQERRLNATLTSARTPPPPPPKNQLDWFDCLDDHIKVAIPSELCSPHWASKDYWACISNRQLLRDLVCTFNGFRHMPQHKLWILVDIDAPDKAKEITLRMLEESLSLNKPKKSEEQTPEEGKAKGDAGDGISYTINEGGFRE